MNKTSYLARVKADYRPELVAVNEHAIAALTLPREVTELATVPLPFAIEAWDGQSQPSESLRYAVAYLLGMTALQYRFWALDDQAQFLRYQFKGLVGSTGLSTAFCEAWGNEPYPARAIIEACGSEPGVIAVFGETIPDVTSRSAILKEVLGSEQGTAAIAEVLRYVALHRRVDVLLAERLAEMLPAAYGDPYLKKAMLFLAFVAERLGQGGLQVEVDLCAYADYQVPNVLRHFDALAYAPALAEKIAQRQLLAADGEEERAIRSATILACEKASALHGCTAAAIDWWCFQQRKLPVNPFHLTETTCY